MSDANHNETQEEPLDPAMERVRVKLRRLLLGSTMVMVLGLFAVFAAIIYKLNEGEADVAAYQVPALVTDADLRRASFSLPRGARIINTSLGDTDLAITYEEANGDSTVLLVDLKTWQVYSVLTLPNS